MSFILSLLLTFLIAATIPAGVITNSSLITNGGDQVLSPDGTKLAYDQADASGIYHLYLSQADGSNPVCLSCLSAPKKNVTGPVFTSDGKMLLVKREQDTSLVSLIGWNGIGWISELEENGVWCEVYALNLDTLTWTKLISLNPDITDGIMQLHLSPDGQHLVWSRLTEAAHTNNNPSGSYRLYEADFTENPPMVTNSRDITPKMAGKFFEAHGFSPDGNKLLFSSDAESLHQWNMHIYSLDLSTGIATRLTTGLGWNEHAYYSPSGKKIIFMSSDGANGYLQTEIWTMNPDGSGKQQLTHFNTKGYAETTQPVMPGSVSPLFDGVHMVIGLQVQKSYPQRQMWYLTCQQQCVG